MFLFRKRIANLARPFLSYSRNYHVSVIGATQQLGQTTAFLLKQHPLITRLNLQDAPEETFGVAMDLSHIPREAQVQGSTGSMEALKDSEIVVVASGQPRKGGQTEQEHFRQNADAIVYAMQEIATHCPSAFIVIATEPINLMVPLAAKVLECGDCCYKTRLFGVTGLDSMRIQMLISELYRCHAQLVRVPVICGRSPKTAIPIFSHMDPIYQINESAANFLTEKMRNLDDHVMALKSGKGQPTLSSAYATYCTVAAILNAMNGYVSEHTAFVANSIYGTKFFAAPVVITNDGVSAMMHYEAVSPVEADYLQKSIVQLSTDIREGESYFYEIRQREADVRQIETAQKADTLKLDTRKTGTGKAEKRQKDTRQKNTREKDTRQKDKRQEDTRQEDKLLTDTLQKDTLQTDTLQTDTLQKDTLQKDTLQKDRLQKDTLQKDRLQKDTLQKDTQKDLLRTTSKLNLKKAAAGRK